MAIVKLIEDKYQEGDSFEDLIEQLGGEVLEEDEEAEEEEVKSLEVLEEVGVRVDRIDYIASQPWPFPAQLMLGCIAHAHSRKITIDPKELEDARWVDRDDIIGALEKRPVGISLPPPTAIAHQLLKHWARS